jgi:hypothetical protein
MAISETSCRLGSIGYCDSPQTRRTLDLCHFSSGKAMPQSRPMTFLHTLRSTPWLAKLALLWFALTLGVAVASPMVNPQEELIICTSAGMVKVMLNADGSISTEASGELSCPLCVVGSAAPPTFVTVLSEPVQPLGYVLQSIPAAHIAVATAAPPPSRGPPRLL